MTSLPVSWELVRTPFTWYVLLLVAIAVVPYLLGVRPRGQRQWRYVSITIAFLTWLLLGLAPVR